MITFYEALGVPQDASPDTVKKVYRKLARECHPDMVQARGGNVVEAQERFKRINHAHEVLTDARKRLEYDASLRQPKPAPRAPQPSAPHQGAYSSTDFGWSYEYRAFDWRAEDDWMYDFRETVRLEEEWKAFTDKPLRWYNTAGAWYNRTGYIIVGLASIFTVVWWLTAGNGRSYYIFEYALTRNAAPGVESYVPLAGFMLGCVLAVVTTLAVMIYTIATGWSLWTASSDIRQRLWSRLLDVMALLSIVFGLSGFFIARYLF